MVSVYTSIYRKFSKAQVTVQIIKTTWQKLCDRKSLVKRNTHNYFLCLMEQRQIIRYRATATHRRPQILVKQHTASNVKKECRIHYIDFYKQLALMYINRCPNFPIGYNHLPWSVALWLIMPLEYDGYCPNLPRDHFSDPLPMWLFIGSRTVHGHLLDSIHFLWPWVC